MHSLSRNRCAGASGRAPAAARHRLRVVVAASAAAQRAVLITGSSTGIGRETALYLASKGWQVFAGVRRKSDGEALVQEHSAAATAGGGGGGAVVPLLLDVTSDASTKGAIAEVKRLLDGRNLSGLVNNAGMGTFAPLELMPMKVFDDVMAVNVSGVVRVTQAAIQLLRATGEAGQQSPGRIVNIGSYAGTIALPLFGPYTASKYALEALSDVMRYELGPKWGIHTALIKAAAVKTPIWSKSTNGSEALMSQGVDAAAMAPYQGMAEEVMGLSRRAEAKGIEPRKVAECIEEALTAPRPRSRYLLGSGTAALEMTLRRLLPDWLWDPAILSILPRTRAPLGADKGAAEPGRRA